MRWCSADELGAGVLVAGGTALDQRRFAAANLGPCDGGNRLHVTVLPPSYHPASPREPRRPGRLEPGRRWKFPLRAVSGRVGASCRVARMSGGEADPVSCSWSLLVCVGRRLRAGGRAPGGRIPPADRPRRGRAGPGRHLCGDRELQRRDHAQGRLDARLPEARRGLPAPAAARCGWTEPAQVRRARSGGRRRHARPARAAELDPLAPRPLELLGDISYSTPAVRPRRRALPGYIELDDRSPRVLYKLALAHYSGAGPSPPSRRSAGDRDRRSVCRRRFTCSDSATATCSSRAIAAGAGNRGPPRASAAARARRTGRSLWRTGRLDDRMAQLEALPGSIPARAAGRAWPRVCA